MNRRVMGLPAWAFVVVSGVGFLGCGHKPKVPEQTDDNGPKLKSPEDYIGLASDSLHEGATAKVEDQITFVHARDVVKHLNDYLNALGSKRADLKLAPDQEDLFKKQLHLNRDELAELNSPIFTMLDGHYLETCALLSEALESLEVRNLPALERARVGFDWVVRQVSLKERIRPLIQEAREDDDLTPPQFALLLGYGTAKERAILFLALLQQLGIEGCMIAYPGGPNGTMVYWIPGVLIRQEEKALAGGKVPAGIYLFDTRLGMAVPAPGGQGIARLAQVMKEPEKFRAWHPLEVSQIVPAQISLAEVHLACPLSALSPRVQMLQKQWGNKIQLAVNPVKLRADFAQVTRVPVRYWNPAQDVNSPTHSLRAFLPKEEGGIDNGRRLKATWGQVIPSRLVQMRYPPQLHPKLYKYLDRRAFSLFDTCLRSRNLLIRGRVEEATKLLNQETDTLQEKTNAFLEETSTEENKQTLDQAVKAWCEALAEVADQIQKLREEGPNNPDQQRQAQRKLNDLLTRDDRVLNFLGYTAAAELVGKESSYLLCLCMHQKADRALAQREARSEWGNANRWWSTFVERYALNTKTLGSRFQELAVVSDQGANDKERAAIAQALYESLCLDLSRTVAARVSWSQALANLGKRQQASEVLQELVNTLEEWDKQGIQDKFLRIMRFQATYRGARKETAWTSPRNVLWLRLAAQAWLKQMNGQGVR